MLHIPYTNLHNVLMKSMSFLAYVKVPTVVPAKFLKLSKRIVLNQARLRYKNKYEKSEREGTMGCLIHYPQSFIKTFSYLFAEQLLGL